jgi:hypothetical protein
MADTGQNWFIQNFERIAHHMGQQRASQTVPMAVLYKAGNVGQSVNFERLGPLTAVRRNTRVVDTPIEDPAHSRRRAVVEVHDRGVIVSDIDDIMMLASTETEYHKAAGYLVERTKDSVLFAAMGGNALEVVTTSLVDSTQTLTTVALPAGQIVASTADVYADFRTIKTKFDRAGIDPNDRFVYAPPEVEAALLASTVATSADYQTVKIIASGDVGQMPTFLGFRFVKSLATVPSAGVVRAYFWQRDCVGVAAPNPLDTMEDSRRPDKMNALQIAISIRMGAVRIEDAGVVAYDYTIPV